MSGFLLHSAKPQFLDRNGRPMSGGTLEVYEYGTTTLATVYTDLELTILGANPVTLNARGEPPVSLYLRTGSSYGMTLKNSLGAVEYTAGPVVGGSGASGDGGAPIIVPQDEVDRIIAEAIADPDLLNLFTPLNATTSALTSSVSAINGRLLSIDGSVNLLNGNVQDLQAQVDELSAIGGDVGNVIAMITSEETARVNADGALAGTIAKIGAASPDGVSFILNTATAKISESESIAQRLSGIQTDHANQQALLVAEQTTRATADDALSAQLGKLGALNAAGSAFVINLDTAYVSPTQSLAAKLASVQTAVDGANAAVLVEQTARQNADNSIGAKYTVKVDVNGKVAGFGLISTANDGAVVSTFDVAADAFRVFNGTSAVPVFSVSGGNVYAANLVVGTGAIAGNAISAVDSYTVKYNGGFVVVPADNEYVLLAGAVIYANGVVDGSVIRIDVMFAAAAYGGANDNITIRLARSVNSGPYDHFLQGPEMLLRAGVGRSIYNWSFIDPSPPAGDVGYVLQLTRSTSGNVGNFGDVQFITTLLKR